MNKVIDSSFLLFCQSPPDICSLRELAGVVESIKTNFNRKLTTPSESTRHCEIPTPKKRRFYH
jgi:hypothetical protein